MRFLFVIHFYLFKPDHGHHHLRYLSCFSETSKPQHTEQSQRQTEQSSLKKQTRFTTAGPQSRHRPSWLLTYCTYEMPETLFMSRLSCSRMETFIGTPVSCNTKPSMKSCCMCYVTMLRDSFMKFHSKSFSDPFKLELLVEVEV